MSSSTRPAGCGGEVVAGRRLEQNLAAPTNLSFDDDELWAIDEHAVDSCIDLWEGPRTA